MCANNVENWFISYFDVCCIVYESSTSSYSGVSSYGSSVRRLPSVHEEPRTFSNNRKNNIMPQHYVTSLVFFVCYLCAVVFVFRIMCLLCTYTDLYSHFTPIVYIYLITFYINLNHCYSIKKCPRPFLRRLSKKH